MKTLEQISGNVNEVDCYFWEYSWYQLAVKLDVELYYLFHK